MANDTDSPDKKIIVDEGWKSQVEAEREAVRHQEPSPPPPPPMEEHLPPPSLSYLVGTLYLQAAIGLGILPNPMAEKKYEVHLGRAKHAIDTLQVLQEKTEGNRTPEETSEIEAMLHQLRLAYIEVREHGAIQPEA
jgi:hypothetical protein